MWVEMWVLLWTWKQLYAWNKRGRGGRESELSRLEIASCDGEVRCSRESARLPHVEDELGWKARVKRAVLVATRNTSAVAHEISSRLVN
jgi:hypothetical protein